MSNRPRRARPLPDRKHCPRNDRLVLWILGAGVTAVVLIAVWWSQQPLPPNEEPSPEEVLPTMPGKDIPFPTLSASRFLNSKPEVRYVGSEACAGCHPRNHESYLLTAHSKALAEVNPDAEPRDDYSFPHPRSGRSYRVYHRDGQLRHEEVVKTPDGKEISRMDLPLRYLVGSGHFSRTYLVEVDGFLHESPITWYESRKRWDMSPGYDAARHWGFERNITVACLSCHVGRLDAGGTVNRITIQEKAIGCENCHGPGAEHVALRRRDKPVPKGEDRTIVHPGRLSRERLEDICAACHLNDAARVSVRGRQATDFRPGMPLTDYRIDYRLDSGNDQMKVVGHVEQLRQSLCYQKSEDLTCVTCHDPHARKKPKDPTAFYRQKCLDCHDTKPCKSPMAKRLEKDPTDNCVTCHMPRGDTDIPHLAFTHHRIGKHDSKSSDTTRIPELVPTGDVSHLTQLDQKRNLGLAYQDVVRRGAEPKYAEAFTERARKLLEAVYAEGLREGETAEALAAIYLKSNPARSKAYARQAVEAKGTAVEVRTLALIHLATLEAQDGNVSVAIELLKELVRLRRESEDWGLLGACYLLQKQPREALPALHEALSIRPDNPSVHVALAEAYRRLGDVQRAREHQEKARFLSQR